MARLGKLVKTLKIGIGTATDFLKSKGFTVEEDFNSKLTGEQEALLLKEFATPDMLAEFEAQKKESKKAKVEEPKKEAKKPEAKAEQSKSNNATQAATTCTASGSFKVIPAKNTLTCQTAVANISKTPNFN